MDHDVYKTPAERTAEQALRTARSAAEWSQPAGTTAHPGDVAALRRDLAAAREDIAALQGVVEGLVAFPKLGQRVVITATPGLPVTLVGSQGVVMDVDPFQEGHYCAGLHLVAVDGMAAGPWAWVPAAVRPITTEDYRERGL